MTGIQAAFPLLWAPFAASVAFVLIHSYFGIHVLRRNVVFADLALSQLAALGATIAFAIGYSPLSAAGFAYAFLFTVLGAVLLTLSRRVAGFVSQEAFVGVLYVMATAATVLVVDQAPQGAEHVKKILVGSILTVSPETLLKFAAIYATIGFLHFLARLLAPRVIGKFFPHKSPRLKRFALGFLFLSLLWRRGHQLGWNGGRPLGLLFSHRASRNRIAFFAECGCGSGHRLGHGHCRQRCGPCRFLCARPSNRRRHGGGIRNQPHNCLPCEGALFR